MSVSRNHVLASNQNQADKNVNDLVRICQPTQAGP